MLVVLCDTSVLIAGVIQDHPDHSSSFNFLQEIKNKKIKGYISAHSLAECYSVLTNLPGTSSVSPEVALELIEKNFLEFFEVVALNTQDYLNIIRSLSKKNLRGGIVFDAIILHAAKKKKIPVVITWNLRHFAKLAGDEMKIETPESF